MKSDRPQDATRFTRRDLMKMAAAGAALVSTDALKVAGVSAAPLSATAAGAQARKAAVPAEWTGHSRRLGDYHEPRVSRL